ncbi:MAG: PstS family phosphate ABC transporter substrate-binding protein [Candidatus Cloacimonetes bacterium]|nr:PstS family phosphate ABC transporter substrate-binding protein [Candidatus Cloacimonadota bacterium]
MKKVLILIFILILTLFMVFCTQKSTSIDIAGSTTVLPIVQAIAEIFMDLNPEINVSVRGGGSSIGIKSAIDETIDIGNSSREIKDNEIEILQEKNKELKKIAIAQDAITMIVHKSNKIKNLSIVQLKKIYSGKITNWKELGGNNKNIIVISRDVSSGSFEVFYEKALKNSKLLTNCMMLASNNAVAGTVSYTPGAIGYVGRGYANQKHNILSLENISPTTKNVLNKTYPLSRKLFIFTTEQNKKTVDMFINFVLSEKGQEIVEKQGYVKIVNN